MTAGDLAVAGGSLVTNSIVLADDGTTATFQVTATDNSTADLSVAVKNTIVDLHGNTLVANSTTLAVDTVNPMATVAIAWTPLSDPETATITFTLSEASTDFVAGDIVSFGGTLGPLAGSGTSYTTLFTKDATNTAPAITVDAGTYTDAAGNSGSGAVAIANGGVGDDQFIIGADMIAALSNVNGTTSISGGSGFDTIVLSGANITFDLTPIVVSKPGAVTGIEKIDLTGSGNNQINLSLNAVLGISDDSASITELRITGNGGDQVYLGDLGVQGNWSADSDVVSSAGIDYQRWYHTDGAIQVSLLVQTGVAVI